jgi:hypothetical protein
MFANLSIQKGCFAVDNRGRTATIVQPYSGLNGLPFSNSLFGKEKCRMAAVPATVPGTKAHNATVDDHGKASE